MQIGIEMTSSPEDNNQSGVLMPAAYMYEVATFKNVHGEYDGWRKHITQTEPHVPENSVRNLQPLYTRAEPAKPLPAGLEKVLFDWERWAQSADSDQKNPDLLHALKDIRNAATTHPEAAAVVDWQPIETFDLNEREYAVFWCKHEHTIWHPMTGYLRYSGGEKDKPFFVIPCQAEYGARTDVTHWMPLPLFKSSAQRGAK